MKLADELIKDFKIKVKSLQLDVRNFDNVQS